MSKKAHDIPGNTITPPAPETIRIPRVGEFVLYGSHGVRQGIDVVAKPALVCCVREELEDGIPWLDLYVWSAHNGTCGFVWQVKGHAKLRVGGWAHTAEVDPVFVEVPAKPDTGGPVMNLPRVDPPPNPANEEPDPQIEGVPNVFGGRTRYNAARDLQDHSNDKGEKLYICATCRMPRWFNPNSKLPEDMGCCTDQIKRRHPGLQSAPDWELWKIPSDMPVGAVSDVPTDDGRTGLPE